MNQEIKKRLRELSDKEYSEFSGKLIPGSKPLIGVRLPILRDYAKSLVKELDWRGLLLESGEDKYFEEVMIRGMVIGYGCSKSGDIDEALTMLDKFIPMVDNWSVCDSFCVSCTLFKKHRQQVYEHIQKYIYSEKEFEVRVGLILLLDYFLKCDANGEKLPRRRSVEVSDLTENTSNREVQDMIIDGLYIDRILGCVNRAITQGYYAMMAAAWLTAECFVTFPAKTYKFLSGENLMDKVTYNKALQKICESRTPSDEVKSIIREIKL